MQSGNVQRRVALIRTTQHQGQHDDPHRPESSGQKHHALGVDRKSPKEMLGMDTECVVVDGNKRPSQDEYKNTNERNLVDVPLSIEASRILPKRYE
jgi:hypothetical protein